MFIQISITKKLKFKLKMLSLLRMHHIAIICSDYHKSKSFYTEVLGFSIVNEIYRSERDSYKLDLSLNGTYIIELFSFPSPPQRLTQPEANGLRHLAFNVLDINNEVETLRRFNIPFEPLRFDKITRKHFTFFKDPNFEVIFFRNSLLDT